MDWNQLAKREVALSSLTKDELVELLRAANIPVGDYARKTKQTLADLALVHSNACYDAAAKLAGAPEVQHAPDAPAGHIIPAKFAGRCKTCNGGFAVGHPITRRADGKWVHAQCVNASPMAVKNVIAQMNDILTPAQLIEQAERIQQQREQDQQNEQQDGDEQPKQQPQSKQSPDAFVVAVRDAIASNGQTGLTLISKVAAEIAEQIKPVAPAVDMTAIRAEIDERLSRIEQPQAREIVVKVNDAPAVKLEERTHEIFPKLLKLVAAGECVMLKGPAGCGKSHVVEQVARALGRPFSANSVTSGMSESQLSGYLLPVGESGRFEYVDVPFVRAYTQGGLHLFDEMDAADPNVLLLINAAIANGHMHIPQRIAGHTIERHKDFGAVGAVNTFGRGADMLYVGRAQLDEATLDRFYPLVMDYDKALEASFGDPAVCEWVWNLRAKAEQHKLRRVVSTRMIMRLTRAVAAGVSLKEAQRDVLAGWTRDELAKVGAA